MQCPSHGLYVPVFADRQLSYAITEITVSLPILQAKYLSLFLFFFRTVRNLSPFLKREYLSCMVGDSCIISDFVNDFFSIFDKVGEMCC